MKSKNTSRLLRRISLFLIVVIGLLFIVLGIPRVYYNLTHWPKIESSGPIVAFADYQFTKCRKLSEAEVFAGLQIPESEWPLEIKRLSPIFVELNSNGLDIVLHTGGVFRGNTGFWILRETQSVSVLNIQNGDVVRTTDFPRIIKYDLKY